MGFFSLKKVKASVLCGYNWNESDCSFEDQVCSPKERLREYDICKISVVCCAQLMKCVSHIQFNYKSRKKRESTEKMDFYGKFM